MVIDLFDIIEFSKIYKRVMSIELTLKERFISSLNNTFGDKMFYRLIPFLSNFEGRYNIETKFGKIDRIKNLLNDKKKNEYQKVKYFVRIAYLSDILLLLTSHSLLYKNNTFNKYMYCEKIGLNNLKQHASKLRKLRNAIMHFDFNYYKSNKASLILTLNTWEQLIRCNNFFIHKLPPVKIKTATILKMLANNLPGFFNTNDRIVCDVFDDVAFINGCEVRDLPKYWSIIRGFYFLKSNYKKKEG